MMMTVSHNKVTERFQDDPLRRPQTYGPLPLREPAMDIPLLPEDEKIMS